MIFPKYKYKNKENPYPNIKKYIQSSAKKIRPASKNRNDYKERNKTHDSVKTGIKNFFIILVKKISIWF